MFPTVYNNCARLFHFCFHVFVQEEIMNKYNSCQDELIMFSYLSGTVFVALACLYTGDLIEGVHFIHNQVTEPLLACAIHFFVSC